jgi:nucleobase:cation symporter-1, NCS1 family
MLAPPLAATVSSVMSLGFTARETIPIVFFGFAICSVVVTLTGKMVRGTAVEPKQPRG